MGRFCELKHRPLHASFYEVHRERESNYLITKDSSLCKDMKHVSYQLPKLIKEISFLRL